MSSTSLSSTLLPGHTLDPAARRDVATAAERAAAPAPGSPTAYNGRVATRLARSDRGMTTAEYAVGTVAACGFGGVLWKVLTSDQVVGLITDLVRRALSLAF
jgi:hypothetical protein